MARRVIVLVTDDLDPSQEATVERTLGWDGVNYELDLSETNDKALYELLRPYLDAAHDRVKQAKPPKPSGPTGTLRSTAGKGALSPKLTSEQRAAVRKWAWANGYKPGHRGIIANGIVEAYERELVKGNVPAHPDGWPQLNFDDDDE